MKTTSRLPTFVTAAALFFGATVGCGCASKQPTADGDARVAGAITGLAVTSDHAHALAWSTPPAVQIVISPDDLACSPKGGGDRVVLDVAAQSTGTFTIAPGHPYVSFLSSQQARAEVCPAGDPANQPPCHELVRGGSVTITRIDPGAGGIVEGTFHVELADGTVDGTFSAPRCS